MGILRQVYSLRAAVIVIVLVPLLAVFGVGGLIALGSVERRVEARMKEEIALIARTLRAPLARSLEQRRDNSLDRSLRSTSQISRVYGVYLYDASGTLIARADQSADGVSPAIASLDLEKERIGGTYRSMDGREVYSYFTPLTGSGGQNVGMLQVTRRASEIQDYLADLRRNVVLIMLGIFALFVGIVLLGYHFAIGRPLNRLAEAMDVVGGGDVGARAAATGPAELRTLAQRFNSMLAGIAERDAVLERERAEQARLERRLRQSEKSALVGRLAAGVAHELGAPLSVIDGQAQRLLRGAEPGSKEQGMLLGIRGSAERMATIVRQLLGFSREAAPEHRRVTMQRLVSLAAADVRAVFEKQSAQFEVVAASPEAEIDADEGRMREALAHLLRNALQASGGGRVRIGWQQQGAGVRLFIENSGRPIPTQDHKRIFEPFYTTKEPGEGSGLGLAIVNATVADHGAEIAVYDSPLGGAGFRIDFPGGDRA
ncbi:MAG: sensor histidine kinase [Gammaproteobacteria bacterium]|nr:sensor histidine kinase [Gammaproteobacteria bacterium]